MWGGEGYRGQRGRVAGVGCALELSGTYAVNEIFASMFLLLYVKTKPNRKM